MTSVPAINPDEQYVIASTPVFSLDLANAPEATGATATVAIERPTPGGKPDAHAHWPTRVFGECAADHRRRGAPSWSDMPEVLPLGEEGGTAWTPDNAWLREESAPRR